MFGWRKPRKEDTQVSHDRNNTLETLLFDLKNTSLGFRKPWKHSRPHTV